MEEVSGQSLGWFFEQWLHRTISPGLAGTWSWDDTRKVVVVELRQTQAGAPYRLALDVGVVPDSAGAPTAVSTIEFTGATTRVEIPTARAPRDVVLDPRTRLLMTPPAFTRK